MKSIFITGTGTGVGKTVITAGCAFLLQKQGYRVGVMKAVQTGAKEVNGKLRSMDMDFIESVMQMPQVIQDPCLKTPVMLRMPASPHLAAEEENNKINPQIIIDAFHTIQREYQPDYLLIEGAGGLYVPLTRNYFMFHLIKDLHMPVLLVAHAGLGTINHTLLSVNLLQQQAIPIKGIIINQLSTPISLIEKDNIKTIAEISGIQIWAVIPTLPGLDVDRGIIASIQEVFDQHMESMMI